MLQKCVLCVLFTISLNSLSLAQKIPAETVNHTEEKEIQNEILKIEQSKVRALLKGGAVAADWIRRYFADDIEYITGTGTLVTKAQTVEEFQTGERKLVSIHHDDYRVNVYNADTAILVYHSNDVMLRKGKTLAGADRMTDVYVKFPDGVWRTVLHQVTPVPKH